MLRSLRVRLLLWGDPARFRQIVRNLLSNAWTHTPEGGRILVRAQEAGKEIEVCVQGGRVWAESRPGQGSSFFFTIPKATDVTP